MRQPQPARLAEVVSTLRSSPARWLVTGAAGFIGSNLVGGLLGLDQRVVGLDNLSSGSLSNVENVLAETSGSGHFELIEGDIRDPDVCARACDGADFVLHQAALASVHRSLRDPAETNEVNVGGTINVFVAARDAGVQRLVYASSSAVYGDDPRLPKVEGQEGEPLSPYAASKVADEVYAGVFQRAYGLRVIGLRYFNVFGPRQSPDGPYAAVIPRWISALTRSEPCHVHGDGQTTRDFCHVANVVQANLLAALAPREADGGVYNVATGAPTSLNELYAEVRNRVVAERPGTSVAGQVFEPFREGDIRHSQADLTRIRAALGYEPTHDLAHGLDEALPWYLSHLGWEARPAGNLPRATQAGEP